jgi:hypothetical protein
MLIKARVTTYRSSQQKDSGEGVVVEDCSSGVQA